MLDLKIKKIVLTGGPCAGKTEIFGEIEKFLVSKDYYVITLPETARQLIEGKILPCGDENLLLFQDIMLKIQHGKEEAAIKYAEEVLRGKDVVILYDRALMDNRAYLNSQEEFEFLLQQNNLDEYEVIYDYDLVIDLISTATCKKELYQLDGVRKEPVEVAEELDKKTTLAWINHPRLITVKPTESIDEKVDIVIGEIDNFLNGTEYNNTFRKYIGDEVVFEKFDDNNSKTVDVCKSYIENDMVLTQKKYRGSSIFTLGKFNNSFDSRIISVDDAIEIITKKPVLFTESYREIYFTNNGNVYKLIDDGKDTYLSYNKSCTAEEVGTVLPITSKKIVKGME